MKLIIVYLIGFYFSISVFSQSDKSDAFKIMQKLQLNEEDKFNFQDSFELERDVKKWKGEVTVLKEEQKKLKAELEANSSTDLKKTITDNIQKLNEEILDKNYDIAEYTEIVNTTRYKIYMKAFKNKYKKLSGDDLKKAEKYKETGNNYYCRIDDMRKRAKKQQDYELSVLMLMNAADIETSAINEYEKALKILLAIEKKK